MISQSQIREIATKQQTTEINVAREYLQHLFLSHFYKQKGSEKFLFKGGTALRIVFQGERYSEDLDFSIPPLNKSEIEEYLVNTFAAIEDEGITGKITECKETSGGYLANIDLDILGFKTGISSNLIIKNDPLELIPQNQIIESSNFLPNYTITALSTEIIVKEKIQALITRAKPRDFYDLYFISRNSELKKYIPRDPETTKGILASLEGATDKGLATDLKPFLPVSHQFILKELREKLVSSFTY